MERKFEPSSFRHVALLPTGEAARLLFFGVMNGYIWVAITLIIAVVVDRRKLFRPHCLRLSFCECRISWLNLAVAALIAFSVASIPHEVSPLIAVWSVVVIRLANVATTTWRRGAEERARSEGRGTFLARAKAFLDAHEPGGAD